MAASWIGSWIGRTMCYLGLADDEDYPAELGVLDSTSAGDPLVPAPLPEPERALVQLIGEEPAPRPERFAPVRLIPSVDEEIVQEPADRAVPLAPETFDDVTEIADRVAEGWMIELSLDRVGPDLKRRIIDFCSGLVYARGGTMQRSGPSDYLLSAPMPPLTAWESDLRRLA
jgi:cell division inhibitor SepF